MGEMSVLSKLYERFYGGDIGTRLAVAEKLFRVCGEELAQDPQVSVGMTNLSALHQALRKQMLAMGMDRTCTLCAQRGGGGCCSAAFAAETDVAQLLMNMLAGVAVVVQRKSEADCRYLGEKGCIFLFKPMFCLNYNCSNITLGGRYDALRSLEKQTGMILQAQQVVENRLIELLKNKPF